MKKNTAAAIAMLFIYFSALAQEPDKVYMPNIHGVKFFLTGKQNGYPIINLGSQGAVEIHFDDFDGNVKTYNYTYLLCNADWTTTDLSPFDYIQGFGEGRFTQYYNSATAKTKYTHYQAVLPEAGAVPKLSGNYLLLVYLDGDTSKLAFTRRLMVVNKIANANVQVQHPFSQDIFYTHQKIQITLDKTRLNILNQQQQLKIVVMQNYRWDNAITGIQPQFLRGNLYEYNGEEDCEFPAGKEYRWVNLESYRLWSERVERADDQHTPVEVYLKPDPERTKFAAQNYTDYDGFFQIASTDVTSPWWQGDYANVHFIYAPQNHQPYEGKDVYIAGELTSYKADDDAKMEFNADKGVYEKTMLLKQGYYTYSYYTKDAANADAKLDPTLTDGNLSETENLYTVLVYYRSFSDRADELVGCTTVSSLTLLK